jgi:release factor glutamine methyltransferase
MEKESVSANCRGLREDDSYACKSKKVRVSTIEGIVTIFNEEVYIPSDDTFIIVEGARYLIEGLAERRFTLVEIGCGTGYVAISILKNALNKDLLNIYAVLIDISPCAVDSAAKSVKVNELDTYVDIVQCNSASCLRGESMKLILFNPPYLPVEDYGGWLAKSWSGGREGLVVWNEFFDDSLRVCGRDCIIVFVISSLQNLGKVLQRLLSNCKCVEILMCESFFYETICSASCKVGEVN